MSEVLFYNDDYYEEIDSGYRIRLSSYLMSKTDIESYRVQYMYTIQEKDDAIGVVDPLDDVHHTPVYGITQRYSNRVTIYLTNSCAAFCRFCLRKRKIGERDFTISKEQLNSCVAYIEGNPEITEVLLTGGDPLSLSNEYIDEILSKIKGIRSVKIVRICTRFPFQQPSRIDSGLCEIMSKQSPLYMVMHVNHPDEITEETKGAIAKLRKTGNVLLSQTVLLRKVNDNTETLSELFNSLVCIGIKPYHLYQANRVKGTSHFIVPMEEALTIFHKLWERSSGLALPIFVYNSEGGRGKIPLFPSGMMLNDAQLSE